MPQKNEAKRYIKCKREQVSSTAEPKLYHREFWNRGN